MTSSEIDLQRRMLFVTTKVKPAMSAHYVADAIPLLAYLIFPSNQMLR